MGVEMVVGRRRRRVKRAWQQRKRLADIQGTLLDPMRALPDYPNKIETQIDDAKHKPKPVLQRARFVGGSVAFPLELEDGEEEELIDPAERRAAAMAKITGRKADEPARGANGSVTDVSVSELSVTQEEEEEEEEEEGEEEREVEMEYELE